MQTLTIEVIEEKAMQILEGMESLQLIRLHKNLPNDLAAAARVAKLKGAMTKQPIEEVDKQLKELRDAWE